MSSDLTVWFTDSIANANNLNLQTLLTGSTIELLLFTFALLVNQPNIS